MLKFIKKAILDILAPGWEYTCKNPAIPIRFTKAGYPYTTVEDVVNSDAFKRQMEACRKERLKRNHNA